MEIKEPEEDKCPNLILVFCSPPRQQTGIHILIDLPFVTAGGSVIKHLKERRLFNRRLPFKMATLGYRPFNVPGTSDSHQPPNLILFCHILYDQQTMRKFSVAPPLPFVLLGSSSVTRRCGATSHTYPQYAVKLPTIPPSPLPQPSSSPSARPMKRNRRLMWRRRGSWSVGWLAGWRAS